MESRLIESDFNSTTTTTLLTNTSADLYNKAWNLLRILLEIGHPVPPVDLTSSSISISFESSPEFIEFLCSLPDSPLSLTSDCRFVTISTLALAAFSRFFISTNIISPLSPRLRLDDFGPKKVWENVERTYYRKRMRLRSYVVLSEEEEPLLKKRAIVQNSDAEKDLYIVLGLCASSEAPLYLKDAMKRSMIMHQGESSVRKVYPNKSDDEATTSSTLLSYELNNEEHVIAKKADTSASKKELGCLCKPVLEYSFHRYERFPLLPNRILGVKAFMPYNGTFHLNINPVLRREDMMKNIYFLSLNSGSASCQEVDELKRTFPVEAKNAISSYKPVNTNCSIAERSMEGREQITDSCSQKENTEKLQINTISMGMPGIFLRCIDTWPSREERTASCQDVGEQNLISPVELENTCAHQAQNAELPEDERVNNGKDKLLIDSGSGEADVRSLPVISPSIDMQSRTYLAQEETPVKLVSKVSVAMLSNDQKQLTVPYANPKFVSKDAINPKAQTVSKVMVRRNSSDACMKPQQFNVGKRSICTKQKLKKNCDTKTHVIEKRENSVENKEKPCSMKNQLEPKILPKFDSFVVEEEEGSGGYGTVYKAKRKKDGVTFAVKCPHANANRHHVLNELKMLERFGGKNFVIMYEGSFRTGNSDCIVLEHFEHDRPEVLKREIDVFQLQWYGYCLFRALASIHKQGVVHRDVKPGNFLFSRKVNKGYLIDFNLALDVHQKYGPTEKSKVHYDLSSAKAPLPCMESLPPAKSRKLSNSKAFEAAYQEAGNRSKSLLKSLKKKTDQAKGHPDLSKNCILKSQGADGSGITSAKDATSTRVTSAERLREPVPCQGRKELISLAQEAMQSPNQDIISIPASKRKRVAAPPGKVDKNFVYLTPMPLHSTGSAVAGAGLLKTKGEGKHRKEGPCVGTKGFRAPEVLVRSAYQGPKVDIWSAGVTLLYLITGRAPFAGDPDQNIKEIAKLRGSEDLWEVAKLHNRESSFPAELLDINSLPSMKLREWCKLNTRRADFHERIPRSLFDLVDKCLTVNPRLRLSAEDALRHEFFAPCIEQLKKQRLRRQGLSLDTGTTLVLETQPQTCEGLS